jgi:AcrR family transcriptional regulator
MADPPDDVGPRQHDESDPSDPNGSSDPAEPADSADGPDAPEDRAGSSRQRQADATRRQLLAAAGDIFESSGYQATTVRAITARANTAHGTFYLYFQNKEDVFCRVMETVIVDELEVGTHTFLEAGPDRGQLADAIRRFSGAYARHVGLWRALLEGMLQSRAIRDLWLELRRRTVVQLADQMRSLHVRGLVRSVDPLPTAHAMTAMTEWFAFTHFALDEPGTDGSSPDLLVDTLADLWLHAVYGRITGVEPGVG